MSSPQQPQPTIIYPRFPAPLDQATVESLFTPRAELEWAMSVTRSGDSRVWLLTFLKSFEILGYFPATSDVPTLVLQHVASACCSPRPVERVLAPRTLYRNHRRVRRYLGISAWSSAGHRVAQDAMESAAQARLNPADLINAAIEALVQARYELPALSLFRRLAGSVSERTQRHSMALVHTRLSPEQWHEIDALLVVDSPNEWSPFGRLCQHAGSVTRANVKQMIERLHSVPVTIDRH